MCEVDGANSNLDRASQSTSYAKTDQLNRRPNPPLERRPLSKRLRPLNKPPKRLPMHQSTSLRLLLRLLRVVLEDVELAVVVLFPALKAVSNQLISTSCATTHSSSSSGSLSTSNRKCLSPFFSRSEQATHNLRR